MPTAVKRDKDGYDKDGYRVVWSSVENLISDEDWRAWCAAGCPRMDAPAIDRTREVITHGSDGRVKVKPPYHKIVNNGSECCTACGEPIVAVPHTRSGWKHAKRWSER